MVQYQVNCQVRAQGFRGSKVSEQYTNIRLLWMSKRRRD